MSPAAHIPVLLNEVVQAINLPDCNIVVDATYGRGGHSRALLKELPSQARLIVIDRDRDAVDHAESLWQGEDRVEIFHAPFSSLASVLGKIDLIGKKV